MPAHLASSSSGLQGRRCDPHPCLRMTPSAKLCLSFTPPRCGVRGPVRGRGGSGRTAAAGSPAAARVGTAATSARATMSTAGMGDGTTARCGETRVARHGRGGGTAAAGSMRVVTIIVATELGAGGAARHDAAHRARTGRARRQRTHPVQWPPPGRRQDVARVLCPPLCWLRSWRLTERPDAAFQALRSWCNTLGGALLAFA